METPTVDGQAKLHNFFRRRAMMHVEGCWHVNRSPSVSDQAALDIKIKDKKCIWFFAWATKPLKTSCSAYRLMICVRLSAVICFPVLLKRKSDTAEGKKPQNKDKLTYQHWQRPRFKKPAHMR